MENNNPKSNEINKVEEPNTVFESQTISENEIALHPILVQLIEKSIKDIQKGNGISHEEMKKKIKLKYPFLK